MWIDEILIKIKIYNNYVIHNSSVNHTLKIIK